MANKVGRKESKRWVANSTSYDGDGWGDEYDEYSHEPNNDFIETPSNNSTLHKPAPSLDETLEEVEHQAQHTNHMHRPDGSRHKEVHGLDASGHKEVHASAAPAHDVEAARRQLEAEMLKSLEEEEYESHHSRPEKELEQTVEQVKGLQIKVEQAQKHDHNTTKKESTRESVHEMAHKPHEQHEPMHEHARDPAREPQLQPPQEYDAPVQGLAGTFSQAIQSAHKRHSSSLADSNSGAECDEELVNLYLGTSEYLARPLSTYDKLEHDEFMDKDLTDILSVPHDDADDARPRESESTEDVDASHSSQDHSAPTVFVSRNESQESVEQASGPRWFAEPRRSSYDPEDIDQGYADGPAHSTHRKPSLGSTLSTISDNPDLSGADFPASLGFSQAEDHPVPATARSEQPQQIQARVTRPPPVDFESLLKLPPDQRLVKLNQLRQREAQYSTELENWLGSTYDETSDKRAVCRTGFPKHTECNYVSGMTTLRTKEALEHFGEKSTAKAKSLFSFARRKHSRIKSKLP